MVSWRRKAGFARLAGQGRSAENPDGRRETSEEKQQ
jgi:hypothetical protein